jgi:hypothetical protein
MIKQTKERIPQVLIICKEVHLLLTQEELIKTSPKINLNFRRKGKKVQDQSKSVQKPS